MDALNIQFPAELLMPENQAVNSETETGRHLAPALVLGLGSTGVSIVTHLKKRYSHHFSSTMEMAEMVQFLMLDIGEPDKSVMNTLDRVDFQALPVENVPLMANSLKHQKESFSRWWELHHGPLKKDLSDGTGGMRQLGRLALLVNLINVRRRLEEKVSSSLAAFKIHSRSSDNPSAPFRVFVISSTCGGTGSGMVIDILFLLYKLLAVEHSKQVEITLFLIMPSGFIDRLYTSFKQFRLLHANSYALFKELNALTTRESSNMAGDFWKYSLEDIPQKEGPRYALWRPFSRCFIVDNRAPESRIIPIDRLFAIMSRIIFTTLTTRRESPEKTVTGRHSTLSEHRGPSFGTFGFLRLYHRRAAILEYCSRKLAADMAQNWLTARYEEPYSGELMGACKRQIEDMEKIKEGEFNRIRLHSGLREELEIMRKETKALMPRFNPFSGAGRVFQAVKDSLPHFESRVEEVFAAFIKADGASFQDETQGFQQLLEAFMENRLEEEGPVLCLQVIEKVSLFLADYQRALSAQVPDIEEKEQELAGRLLHVQGLIAQKKELQANIDQFFDILPEWLDRALSHRFKSHMAESLVPAGAGLAPVRIRLTILQDFLKEILDEIKSGADALDRAWERDSTTMYFPPEAMESSPPVRDLYRQCWNEETYGEHRRQFINFARELMPLGEIFTSPDRDSARLLIQMLYRYSASVFSTRMTLSPYENIQAFLGGEEESMKVLVHDLIASMEPLILFENAPAECRKTLIWCSPEGDREKISSLNPEQLALRHHQSSDDRDEITFTGFYEDFPITSIEAVKLCQDHYKYLLEKNTEDMEKKQMVQYPLHLERAWNEDFLSLPFLFLDA